MEGIAPHPIELPAPTEDGACSIHEALARRHTIRQIADRPLTLVQLSNLLWAACGVNRKEGPFGAPGKTAASASNSQEVELYVALESGVYLYDAVMHWLAPVAAGDLRALAMNSHQGIESKAPVQLIYVVDLHRLTHTSGFDEPGLHDAEIQKSYYFVDTGIIAGTSICSQRRTAWQAGSTIARNRRWRGGLRCDRNRECCSRIRSAGR